MKTLIMLSAVPASGKTTWAKKYQEDHPNVYIINSDDVRMEITHGDYKDHSRQKEVWELFEKRIHEYGAIPDCTVILDALNDVNTVRLKYLTTTPEFDKKILILFPNTLTPKDKLVTSSKFILFTYDKFDNIPPNIAAPFATASFGFKSVLIVDFEKISFIIDFTLGIKVEPPISITSEISFLFIL